MLSELELLLLVISIIALVVAMVTIIIYYYYSRQRSNNYLEKEEQARLRYFIQETVGDHGQVIGYECLLRQRNQNKWTLPGELDVPLQRVISLLEETFKSLPREQMRLSINLEVSQILSPEFSYFVRWAISKIDPMSLIIEYAPTGSLTRFTQRRLKSQIEQAQYYGMEFCIDDADATQEFYDRIEWLLPITDQVKCVMDEFRKKDPTQWLDLNLQSWNKLAQKWNFEMILTRVENPEDEDLAQQLQIGELQGYRFGKPKNPLID